MAVSAFQKLVNKLFKQFVLRHGREPGTPQEWISIQNEAVRFFNRTKGDPQSMINQRYRDAMGIGFNPTVIHGGKAPKGMEGIRDLIRTDERLKDIEFGKAPKTKLSTLEGKKTKQDEFINKEQWIAKKKQENKEAIERFKKRTQKKTVEDFRDEGDYDPGGFAGGGAVKKFIERLCIKASNDIRQGKGKWKGLDSKQRMVQHDNLTKKVMEFQKTGNTEGLEVYFGMNPHKAFAKAEKQVKGVGDTEDFFTSGRGVYQKEADEIFKQNKGLTDEQMMQKAYDEIKGGSGFTDDYKMDADLLAEQYALQKGKVYTDLPEDQISIYYNPALKRVSQDLLKRREAKKALKDVEQKIELQMYDTKGRKPNAEGGRQDFIFGGSAGLRSLIKRMRGEHKRIFPSKLSKEKLKWAEKFMPEQAERIKNIKIDQLENLLEALKLDKDQMKMKALRKKLNDPNLDFVMEKMSKMPGSGLASDADLAKYVDIDKDILSLEQMIKNKKMVGRKPHESGGLAYMLGDPTYMHLSEGGGGGHGPWTTGQAPEGPQSRPEMPQPQVAGTPDPLKAPRLPNVAPQNMDPQYMQQQMMQKAMMGQQGIPQGIPRVGMMYGGDPGFQFEYGGSWADWHDQHRNQMPIEDYIQTKLPKERLPFRAPMAGGGMGRRAFLKMMAGLASLPFIGKGVQKVAPKAIKEVTEEVIKRGPDGIPSYAFDLIEVVKAKGTKEIMEGIYKRNPPSTKYTYKDVEVIEDGLGTTSVKKPQTKTGSWTDEATDDTIVDDYVDREIGFEITEGEDIVKQGGIGDDAGKVIKADPEYNESTAIMRGDPEGGLEVDELLEVIDEADHLDLKKIADEIKDIYPKKASGGIAGGRIGFSSGNGVDDKTLTMSKIRWANALEDGTIAPGTSFSEFLKLTYPNYASGGLAHMLGE